MIAEPECTPSPDCLCRDECEFAPRKLETCPLKGTCHYCGPKCDYCKKLEAKYDGWEPWEDATW